MMRPEVLHDRASEVLGGAVGSVGAERVDAGGVLSASQDQGRQLRVVEGAVAGHGGRAANAPRGSAEAIRQGIEAAGTADEVSRAGEAARTVDEVVRVIRRVATGECISGPDV